MTDYECENETLRRIVRDLHWMARRYADGRRSRLVRFANRNALKAYGNAVLPQVVAAWAKVIYAVEQGGKW
jgi:hypothetical protein